MRIIPALVLQFTHMCLSFDMILLHPYGNQDGGNREGVKTPRKITTASRSILFLEDFIQKDWTEYDPPKHQLSEGHPQSFNVLIDF
mmetsp:Transcript_18303/g.44927  ORF Transcript_18303/g.44927 Transcript_18303/m.44927 type:complete len:86 (+) Transcript_18303:405-662(+)